MSDSLLRVVVLLAAGLLVAGCSGSSSPGSGRAPGDLKTLLNDNRGRVLIVLLGREGCPGTARATEALDGYVAEKPEQVSIVRLDVPLPREKLEPTKEWKHPFPCFVDDGRKIADKLEFFYYPTLYVFDAQGEKRYVGACDKDKVADMVREILAEKPDAKKKIYTLPMPDVGERAPAFSGTTLAGKTDDRVSLTGKRGLMMIFARTSCRFSAADIPQFKDIADRYRDKGVGVVIVNQGQELDTIKPVYDKQCAGVPVIWDRNGDICKAFGVDAVPFFFVVDDSGKIVARRSFTHSAATNSVNAMLGLRVAKPRFKATEGG